jgi:hypothetical protein
LIGLIWALAQRSCEPQRARARNASLYSSVSSYVSYALYWYASPHPIFNIYLHAKEVAPRESYLALFGVLSAQGTLGYPADRYPGRNDYCLLLCWITSPRCANGGKVHLLVAEDGVPTRLRCIVGAAEPRPRKGAGGRVLSPSGVPHRRELKTRGGRWYISKYSFGGPRLLKLTTKLAQNWIQPDPSGAVIVHRSLSGGPSMRPRLWFQRVEATHPTLI